jgi:hypothetical protein
MVDLTFKPMQHQLTLESHCPTVKETRNTVKDDIIANLPNFASRTCDHFHEA